MPDPQPGILAPLPRLARYLTFHLRPGADAKASLVSLRERGVGDDLVVGLGPSLVDALGVDVEGLRAFPRHVGSGVEVPATPAALWCWLRGDDRGELVHRGRTVSRDLTDAFDPEPAVDAFQYRDSRDLTGYEDGTENPKGDRAVEVGIAKDGSSFVAVQQWVHDLDVFESFPQDQRDDVFGRRLSDNEEFDSAPASAHVKRTAQEDFDPPAFLLRRSMPWADGSRQGLVFVAFGRDFDAYERQLAHMVGADDGIVDALFRFTRPVSGSFFWCPPVEAGRLALGRLGV